MSARRYDFVVSGSGRFPLDMLRYDSAWPAASDDVRRIEVSFERDRPVGAYLALVEVRLARWQKPTPERWASFGWKVVMRP